MQFHPVRDLSFEVSNVVMQYRNLAKGQPEVYEEVVPGYAKGCSTTYEYQDFSVKWTGVDMKIPYPFSGSALIVFPVNIIDEKVHQIWVGIKDRGIFFAHCIFKKESVFHAKSFEVISRLSFATGIKKDLIKYLEIFRRVEPDLVRQLESVKVLGSGQENEERRAPAPVTHRQRQSGIGL